VGWPGNKKRKVVPVWEHIHAEKAESAWGAGAKEIRLTWGAFGVAQEQPTR
jgi:hypothetical protein